MTPSDDQSPFLNHPLLSALLRHPETVTVVPGSRNPKSSTEDSLFAETLKSVRTLQNCIALYRQPQRLQDPVQEVTIALLVGDGLNGWPEIMHGGVVATVIDEAMGVWQWVNQPRVQERLEAGEEGIVADPGYFTAELKITYVKPVRTPGVVVVRTWWTKREGRKVWMEAEIRQEGGKGEEGGVVCARGVALFVQRRVVPEVKL